MILNQELKQKILAYTSAHLGSSSNTVSFESDTIEAVLDTGSSRTLTCDRKDFIRYTKTNRNVDGIGTHHIVGKDTLKYTATNDNGCETNMILHDVIHVPTLNVRILSVQQFAKQYKELRT